MLEHQARAPELNCKLPAQKQRGYVSEHTWVLCITLEMQMTQRLATQQQGSLKQDEGTGNGADSSMGVGHTRTRPTQVNRCEFSCTGKPSGQGTRTLRTGSHRFASEIQLSRMANATSVCVSAAERHAACTSSGMQAAPGADTADESSMSTRSAFPAATAVPLSSCFRSLTPRLMTAARETTFSGKFRLAS